MGTLVYHEGTRPGKLEIQQTKPLGNQRDLALAYSPCVVAVSDAIGPVITLASCYTARANLVAVIANVTVVLGLSNIGPLTVKRVIDGKAELFDKFAYIDLFAIEIAKAI